jgi:hypothetical protein
VVVAVERTPAVGEAEGGGKLGCSEGDSGASDAHSEAGKAGSARCTSRQPPAEVRTIGAQPDFFARKNQRSPSRDEQAGSVESPQAGPVRQEKSSTNHFPSHFSEFRYVCSGASTAINAWS